MYSLKAMNDFIIMEEIKPREMESEKKSLIVTPDTHKKETIRIGKVVSIGVLAVEEYKATELEVGDLVVMSPSTGTEITVDGKTFILTRVGNLFATMRKDKE